MKKYSLSSLKNVMIKAHGSQGGKSIRLGWHSQMKPRDLEGWMDNA